MADPLTAEELDGIEKHPSFIGRYSPDRYLATIYGLLDDHARYLQVVQAARALLPHVRHDQKCFVFIQPDDPICTCGRDDTIAALIQSLPHA